MAMESGETGSVSETGGTSEVVSSLVKAEFAGTGKDSGTVVSKGSSDLVPLSSSAGVSSNIPNNASKAIP